VLSTRSTSIETDLVEFALVLDAALEFAEFGGVSQGLIAWEFGVSEASIAGAFADAIAGELLCRVGPDDELGEEMWQLTELGREVCGRTAALTPGPQPAGFSPVAAGAHR
jgi:hypothetical protein